MFVLLRSQSEITFGINILSRYRKSFHHTWMEKAMQNVESPSIKIFQNYFLEIKSVETRGKKIEEKMMKRGKKEKETENDKQRIRSKKRWKEFSETYI